MLGKFGFLLAAAAGRVGRAATQPLVQRCHHDESTAFDAPLRRMLKYFEAVLPRLPPFVVRVGELSASEAQHVCVYSDASYESDGTHGLGLFLTDPVTGETLYAAGECPRWIFERFAPDKVTYIAQLEAVAAVAAYFSFGEHLRGRRVWHFIDNTVALSSLVHGYARRPDMADMSEIFQCAVAGLGIDAWLEWVPSAANVADVPSRLDKDQGVLERVGARRVPLVFPTAEQWDSPASLLGGAAADRAAHAAAR